MSVGATPSLNFIGDTVGDTPPHSMSEMRGIRFASGNSPTTGPISLSDFRNQVLTRDAVQEAKITASDKQQGDVFGYSVSISGDGSYAIVGARWEDTGASQSGAAYIFKRTNSSWAQQAKIQASDNGRNHVFGDDVSISKDGFYAIVGAPGADAAYIFKRNTTNSTWAQQTKIQSSDFQAGDKFGTGVSISGDGSYAIVGALGHRTGTPRTGAAYIFNRTDSSWSQQAKIQSSDIQDSDEFGERVSISADGLYVIVGARYEDTGATNTGSAYIFKRTNSSWSQQAKIQGSDRPGGRYFGEDVSISEDGFYAIVGAPGANAAYIFKRNTTNSTWAQEAKIQGGDAFGYSVSISGDGSYAIVGANAENSGTGASYVFKRTNSTWAQQNKIQSSDIQGGDNFGWSASISEDGSYAIVGAYAEDESKGAAYVFNNVYYI